MANTKNITAANAVIMLSIDGVYPQPQQISGFATDEVFSTDPQTPIVTEMGIDGVLAAGFVFNEVKWTIALQAISDSCSVFDTWNDFMQQGLRPYPANGVLTLPGLERKWIMTKGFLTQYPVIPDAAKTLKMRKFQLTWEKFGGQPT